MRNAISITLFIFVVFASTLKGQQAGCVVTPRSPLFAPLVSPEAAPTTAWVAMSKEIARLTRECPEGLADRESTRLFHSFASQYLEMDIERLRRVWAQQGEPLSEGGAEAIANRRAELRDYLARTVRGDEDSVSTAFILAHGRGPAVAKLGPKVKHHVLKAAKQSPRNARRLEHTEQIAAIQTLGVWISAHETRFSEVEKGEMTECLFNVLPEPGAVPGGYVYRIARETLLALSNSSALETERRLADWATAYARSYGTADDLTKLIDKILTDMAVRRSSNG